MNDASVVAEFRWIEAGAGLPVLCLHGLFGASDHWETTVETLAPRFRAMALTLPIFETPPDDLSVMGLRAHVEAFMDAERVPPAVVVGKGLVRSACDYRPHDFGIAALVMSGRQLSLRFEHDGGQVFVEAGSGAAGWHRLEDVLEFVDHSITRQLLGEPPDEVAMARLLSSNWDKVASLLGDRQRALQLQAFARRKTVALLGSLSREA